MSGSARAGAPRLKPDPTAMPRDPLGKDALLEVGGIGGRLADAESQAVTAPCAQSPPGSPVTYLRVGQPSRRSGHEPTLVDQNCWLPPPLLGQRSMFAPAP